MVVCINRPSRSSDIEMLSGCPIYLQVTALAHSKIFEFAKKKTASVALSPGRELPAQSSIDATRLERRNQASRTWMSFSSQDVEC